MSEENGYGWTLLTADNPIIHDAIVLKRIHCCASAANGEVILHHGTTAEGKEIFRIRAGNYGASAFEFNIRLPLGLYVNIYEKVRHVLVIWEPLEV